MDYNSPLLTSQLRQLQKEINTSIDEYVSMTDGPNSKQGRHELEMKRCQAQIYESARVLALESQEPLLRAFQVGFSVRALRSCGYQNKAAFRPRETVLRSLVHNQCCCPNGCGSGDL